MTACFRADPAATRIVLELDGMTAVYHRPSGMTHLLASPAPEILAMLSAGPLDIATLGARLGETFEVAAEGGVDEVIGDRLAELEAAGLVARG